MDRIVVRVDRGLHEMLTVIAARLFNETRLDYSRAAIARELIAVGLLTVEYAPHLAQLSVGVRVARGRKKGDRRPRP